MFECVQISIGGLSAILGLTVLSTSIMFIDEWRWFHVHHCKLRKQDFYCFNSRGNSSSFQILEQKESDAQLSDSCDLAYFYVIGTSIGVFAGILQLGAGFVGLLKEWKLWCLFHVLVCLAIIISVSISLFTDPTLLIIQRNRHSFIKACIFFSVLCTDFIFSIFATCLMCYFISQR